MSLAAAGAEPEDIVDFVCGMEERIGWLVWQRGRGDCAWKIF